MEGAIRFGLLGPLTAAAGDTPIDLPRRKERQLLAVLVLEANRTVSNDRLIEALWADAPPAKPLTSLRASISNLRKVLPNHPDGEPMLVTEQGGYQLRCDETMIDAGHYEQLLDRAREALVGNDLDEAADLLDEALGFIRGEPLADMAYDEFAQREIGRLTELIIGGQELRAQVALDRDETAAWLPRITELVAAHPLRERLQAVHMVALYRLGRQADALRSYQIHRQSMVDELGIEPAAELQELESKILAQDKSLDRPGRQEGDQPIAAGAGEDATPSVDGEEHPARTTDGRTLVGRESELQLLAELKGDRRGFGFVVGESGSGKSSLVEAFFGRLAGEGWRLARGVCLDDDGVPALWPWRQVVRDLELAAAVSLSSVDEINRFDLFEDLASALLGAAAGGPVAIFLDDVQWADEDTIRLLTHLGRRLRSEPLIIVAAARVMPPALSGQAGRWIELGSLTEGDVGRLIETRTGEPADQALAADLWARTGGNAYFVTELISFARTFGQSVQPDLEIPAHVRELVRQRVQALPARTAELLNLAALEVQSFSPEVLGDVVGDEPEVIRRDLKPAIDGGIIAPDPGAFGRYQFDHAITRETLEADVDPTEAIRFHAALGHAILNTAVGSDQHATVLSRHFTLGAPAGTAAEALHWATVAAEKAASTWSHRDGLVHLRRALDAEQHLPHRDPHRRCLTMLNIGAYCRIVGEVAEAEEALLAAFRLATELEDDDLVAQTALGLSEGIGTGRWRWYWNPGSVATSALEQALDLLSPDDSITRATVMAQLGADGYLSLNFAERAGLLDEAMAMIERVGSATDIAQIRHVRRVAVGWSWGPAEALRHDLELREHVRSIGTESDQLRNHAIVIADLFTVGRLDDAKREVEGLRTQARLRGSVSWRFAAAQWEIFLAQLGGRWAEANERVAEVIDPVTGFGEDFADAMNNQLQITHYFQGRLDSVAEVLSVATMVSDRALVASSLLNVLAHSGRVEEANRLRAKIEPLKPDLDQIGGRLAISVATEGLLLLDDLELIPNAIELLMPAADELSIGVSGVGGLIFFGPVRYYLARALAAVGRWDEAEREIEAGRRHMDALESAPMLLLFDFAEADLAARRDGPAAAGPRLAEVRAAAEQLGMGSVVAAVDRTSERIGES